MMGKGGSNSNTYKYICKGSCKKVCMAPHNYKYNYNLKYMKICARYKFR